MKRDTWVFYTEWTDHFELLNDHQRSALIMAIMYYQQERELPEMDGITQMAFSFIKKTLDRDSEKWQEIVKKRSEAGKKGGRPKKQEKAKKANALSEKQEKAKKAEYVHEYEDVNDIDINKSPLQQTIDNFIDHRKAIKYPMTSQAYNLMINKLDKLAGGRDDMKIAILNQSIENGWRGIFPLKEQGRTTGFNNAAERTYEMDELERKLRATN